MNKPKFNVKSIIVLTAICLIVAALLAVTNHFTSPVVERTRQQKIVDSLKEVLPDMTKMEQITDLPEGTPSTVKSVYRINDDEYAIVLATTSAYSNGDMGITVGMSKDGEILGIKLTSYFESKDFGRDTYPQNFVGKNSSDYADVDTFSGVTYSSKAFKKALGDAFECFKLVGGGAAE